MKLPNASAAFIDLRKLRDYSLSGTHPEGKHKARVFFAALGIGAEDAEWLRIEILAAVAWITRPLSMRLRPSFLRR